MASRGCWKPQLPRTEVAQKYGHLPLPIIKDAIPLKSGLTPMILNPHATDSEIKFADDVRFIQRRLYSTAELERVEALAPLYNTYKDETVLNVSADIAIHPVMQRKKWNFPLPKQAAEFPLGKQLDGYWNAYTNDIVWEALLPSLRIASLYFSNIDMWPWHDGLFASKWTEIPQNEIPRMHFGRRDYRRFITRHPLVYGSEEARRNVRNKLLDFSKNIYFSLTSCFTDTTSGVKLFDARLGSIAGSTIASLIDSICVINLDFRSISALLPGTVEKLNVAEKRLIHCDFAITIIHELALFGGITAGLRGPSGEGKLAHLDAGGMAYARYSRIVGSQFEMESNGEIPLASRHSFVEFEGIPDKKRHAESSMDRLESQGPHKRRRVEHAIVREAVCRQPQRSLEEELGVDDEETVDPEDEDQELPPCPRFHEISKYLIENRRQLALHTMCFAMPEHTLRDYIRRLGGLKISAQEWRAFESEDSGDFSTYRGSIQLHASSWPRTDLTPLRPKREKFEKAKRNAFAFILAVHLLSESQVGSRDIMWPMTTFWDFSAERFLTLFNADVKNKDGDMSKLGLGLMSKQELEDMLWHVASTSPFLTWAPEGIIRRLPLTTPEFMEIRGGEATWDEWDNTKMETDLEVLEEDTGITYTDGRVCSYLEYREQQSIKEKENAPPGPPPTEEELEYMEEEKKLQELIKSVDAYNKKFPNVKQREVFDNALWLLWTVNNPGKSVDEGFEEYKDCCSTPGNIVPSENVMEILAKNMNCDTQ
ncbi:predicted protein [Sclerotinia sclerotiorum 1980 UF-70]|uniref:Uncharacterized protein n=1 Tax=Sclerotinia sclerotiorum (strain ATCC 18683 / 1980 / Ss-1) TaxID=665079 RepID=A7F337_SCLS1|nr:predicted protein [Sclerotinia sclerotiorum 1980 UF-70]EDN96129.1 predicted protein [Sclerotinia sclerotiorum 1980 UF-70]